MKKSIALLLTLMLLFLCCSTVLGDTDDIPAQQDIKVIVDGEEISLKDNNGNPVGALILDGVVYIPVAFISEDIGYNVNWDEITNTLSLDRISDTAKLSKELKENAWNLTDETYYSYEGAYVSKQNEYYTCLSDFKWKSSAKSWVKTYDLALCLCLHFQGNMMSEEGLFLKQMPL